MFGSWGKTISGYNTRSPSLTNPGVRNTGLASTCSLSRFLIQHLKMIPRERRCGTRSQFRATSKHPSHSPDSHTRPLAVGLATWTWKLCNFDPAANRMQKTCQPIRMMRRPEVLKVGTSHTRPVRRSICTCTKLWRERATGSSSKSRRKLPP